MRFDLLLKSPIIIFLTVPETSINIENKPLQNVFAGEFEKFLPSHLEHERAKVFEVNYFSNFFTCCDLKANEVEFSLLKVRI